MNMIRVSHHDLPNPAKRISELEADRDALRAPFPAPAAENGDGRV